MPLIEIVTPAPPNSLHGNRMTALRWQGFLKKLGHLTLVSESWSGSNSLVLIALHAYRSHQSIIQFKKTYPDRPVILIMTGTDLYRDMAVHEEVLLSMKLAAKIVVLQAAALEDIPKKFHSKTTVVYQSVKSIQRKPLLKRDCLVTVIGHLRPEKDPFCTARALAYLPDDSHIKVLHLGKSMSPDMTKIAMGFNKRESRYAWLNQKTHSETLQQLARSHLMVISSLMEGGAHVVSEAIAIGVPVIASDIPGNRGLLGNGYLGYYPAGDEKALSALLTQAETDEYFSQSLEKQIQFRQKFVQKATEMRSIKSLMNEVLKSAA